jgi:hypothetical protein
VTDEDGEEEESGEEGVLAQFVSGAEDIQLIDETHRLAVVDLEWDRIRAVDLLAVRAQLGAVVCFSARAPERRKPSC